MNNIAGRYDAQLPDGRWVREWFAGYIEWDTGGLVETDSRLVWRNTGEDVTDEEANEEVAPGYFLHEWVADKGKFTAEDWL